MKREESAVMQIIKLYWTEEQLRKQAKARPLGTRGTVGGPKGDDWWRLLPAGEKAFIWALMRMIRGAKRSPVGEVAKAARKWEPQLACFMKTRLRRNA